MFSVKTKIIAQGKLKDDKIDSNVLADLLSRQVGKDFTLSKITG
jgi:hypothetical protein